MTNDQFPLLRLAGLIRREAVEQPGSSSPCEVFLAAATRHVRGIPRRIPAAAAVMMSQHGCIGRAGVTRPVSAGRGIRIAGQRPACGIRACQDVVLIRLIAAAVDHRSFFV